jgi:quinol monooxygenase YgiN
VLDIGEWDAPGTVDAYLRSPTFATVVELAETPPRIEYYEPLLSFEWVLRPVVVAACATVVATSETMNAVATYLQEDSYQAVSAMPGVCYYQVGRSFENPSRFLAVHGWSALTDLERFRRDASPDLEAVLATLGGAVDRFTGVVLAEHDRWHNTP